MVVVTVDEEPVAVAETHTDAWKLALEALEKYYTPLDWSNDPVHLPTIAVRQATKKDDLTGLTNKLKRD